MSVLENLLHWSFLSDASLMQAREGYRPTPAASTAAMEFAQRTERMAVQPEVVAAREIAGLSEESLSALATEFAHAPRRKRTDRLRHAIPTGVILFGAGGFGLLLQNSFAASSGAGVLSELQLLSMACLAAGVVAFALGALAAFSMMALDMAYGKVGLYVGMLNEQHPWLYKTVIVMRNSAAQEYRLRVLSERGVLRGVDYVLMREIARADEALVMTQTARTVAEQIQLPQPIELGEVAVGRRLVTMAAQGEASCDAPQAADTTEVWPASPPTSVRDFAPPSAQRRRPA